MILLLVFLGLPGFSEAAFKTNLSDLHVQSVLQSYFPVREYAAVARVTLQEPEVILKQGNKDIVLMIPVDARIVGDETHRGQLTVLVGLNYQAASGGLYLSEPRIQQLEIPSVDGESLQELREFIETIVKNSLPLVRIYMLKEQDLNHSLAKSALKNFAIEDRRLRLEFGFK
jgi:hypothetical protein